MSNVSVMVKPGRLTSEPHLTYEDPESVLEGVDPENPTFAFPERSHEDSNSDLLADTPSCVCLNLEDLKCFEVVDRQYERWGALFKNCVALQPSNPAFPPRSGVTVLMAAPKTGFLEVNFLRPVRLVNAFVTSSQRLILAAYGSDRQLLAQKVLPGANLAHTDSTLSPNTPLTVKAPEIHSITFCAFDGQFTIDDLSFCF